MKTRTRFDGATYVMSSPASSVYSKGGYSETLADLARLSDFESLSFALRVWNNMFINPNNINGLSS